MADYIDRGDYTEIVVDSYETFNKTLSEGEVWENIMINLEAQGASYDIHSGGNSNWTIRNLGFKGQLDADGAPSSQNFILYDPSSSGQSLVENVYHPGTSYSRDNPSAFPSGIYVAKSHAGDLEIRNYHVTNLPSHALYASTMAPSNGGSGGTVHVHNSYCADHENSGWRLGSPGSYVENSVSFRTVRGVWARWDGPIEVHDSDMGDNGTDLITADGGSIEAINTRYGTRSGNVTGSSAGTPVEHVPSGCPTSALEAASGESGGSEPAEPPTGTYLYGSGGTDESSAIVRDDRLTVPGNTYEVTFQTESGGNPDNGVLFGAQSTAGWDNYSGYLVLTNDSQNATQLQRWDSGDVEILDEAPTWPRDEILTLEIDYRDSTDGIICTVYSGEDTSGTEQFTLSSGDSTYGEGYPGFYHWRDDPFEVYWYRDADGVPTEPFSEETFDHQDLSSNYTNAGSGFAITSTANGYALVGDGSVDENTVIYRERKHISPGETYTSEFQIADSANFGFLFGADGNDWASHTGYSVIIRADTNDDIRFRYHDGGSEVDGVTSTAPPTGEQLTAEFDYFDSDPDTVTFTIYDSTGAVVDELSLTGAGGDVEGMLGFHQWIPDNFEIYNVTSGAYQAPAPSDVAMYVNHGDGTGEHRVSNITGIKSMSVNFGDGSGEHPIFGQTSYGYDHGWDARELVGDVADGDSVSELPDRGGDADAVQSTSTNQPTFSTGGTVDPAVSFDSNDALLAEGASLTQPYTIIGVLDWDAANAGGSYAFYGTGDRPQAHLNLDYEGSSAFYAGASGGVSLPMADGPHVFAMVADGDDSMLRIDNYQQTGPAGDFDLAGLFLGNTSDFDSGFEGDLGTLQCWNERLTDAEIEERVTDLGDTWGLPMNYDPTGDTGGDPADADLSIVSGSAQRNEYDDHVEYVIPSGTTTRFEVADGGTVQNVVFDQTATGAAATVWAMHGSHDDPDAMISGWTLRNIAWRGGYANDADNNYALFVSSDGSGDDCLLENIYMGDGLESPYDGPHTDPGGTFYARASDGHIVWDGGYVDSFGDNGIYWSPPGDVGQGGTAEFRNVRSQYSHVGDLRTGSDGDSVHNCCVIASAARGFWLKNDNGGATVTIEDSVFIDEGAPALDVMDGNTVDLYNSVYESTGGSGTINHYDGSGSVSNADAFWPEAAPQTWDEAARADDSDGGGGTEGQTFGPWDYDSVSSITEIYDLVEDDREGGTFSISDLDGTVNNSTEAHTIFAGYSGGKAKSCNALVQFNQRGYGLPQEVYAEVDIYIPADFDMREADTWRFFWNMNRYAGDYSSNSGYGWSNAIGMSDRNNPAAYGGDYHFFTYRYDSSNSGSTGNFTVADGAVLNEGQWHTIGMYVKCNDIGYYNAHQKYWIDDELAIHHSNFQTSANTDAYNHEWGPLAYFIDNNNSSTPAKDRTIYYDNQKYWIGNDIPDAIRE